MIRMTDDKHSTLVGKMTHLKGILDSLNSKYRMLRGSGDFGDALELANQVHTELIEHGEPCTDCEEPEAETDESESAPR